MRNFKLLAFSAILLCINAIHSLAQPVTGKQLLKEYQRCGTMEALENYFQQNPGAREQAQINQARTAGLPSFNAGARTNAITNVPVVVHIVMPNPSMVTDADVQYFINRLNLDFSGLNPDSTNASAAFLAVRGHSEIRFCLAKRDPSGQLSSGIDRVTSNTTSNANAAVDPIKRTALGGADVWTPTAYLNIWVGNDATGGILGYAQFPGTGNAADDGVFLNFQSFANNSCFTIAQYNLARTGTHEVGHYFGLYHIWGDEGGCTGDDFRQLPGTCVLPTGLFNPAGQGNTAGDIGDTPNQANATTNCPVGNATDACATVAPGKMYQNYMDYTADACYSMFTNKQAARMQWVVDNCRAGLKTSLGCTPPAGATTLDAAANSSVNPGGSEFVPAPTCSITYPSSLSCPPGNFVPRVRIINNGLNTLTSVTVGYRLNGGAAQSVVVNPNLVQGGTAVVSLPATNITTAGTFTFRFYTTAPNGATDQVPANDSTTGVLNVSIPSNLPIQAGFESTTNFAAPFTIFNPNSNTTWVRGTPGFSSTGAAVIDNYNNTVVNQIDDIRSPNVITTGTDSVIITFDLAHKNFPNAAFSDTLTILVSTDCGVTFQPTTYKKWGATLATAGSSTADYIAPVQSDWRKERLSIGGPLIASGSIVVALRNIGRYGNRVWIDNINITKRVARDLSIASIIDPTTNVCTPNLTPRVVVSNNGSEAVSSFKVGYRIGAGANTITTFNVAINPGATTTVVLPTTLLVASSTFTVFTADPVSVSGTGDQSLGNDTTNRAFTLVNLVNPPIVQGFETLPFPPANWLILNPNANVTWIRAPRGRNSDFSTFFDNYNNNVVGQIDDIRAPATRLVGADSLIISFDLAHKNFTGFADSLLVLVSTDCGNVFTNVYRKGGVALATAGASGANYTNPLQTDWRRERIALGPAFTGTGSAVVTFRNFNGYGNNVFLDNINIEGLYKRDLQLVAINQPNLVVCTPTNTPSVTVKNVGVEVITAFKVGYRVDGAATPIVTTFTGVNILRDASLTVNLTPVTLPLGPHTIQYFSFEPVTVSGTGDPNPSNDTLSRAVSVVGTQAAPLIEGFEGASLPPANWGINNPDGLATWEKSSFAKTGTGSAVVKNFSYNTAGRRDELYSPNVTFSGADSLFLSFDVSAATKLYPGSTALNLDTLEVLLTADCGNTFTTVYKKWGNELQSISNPNDPQTTEFLPVSGDYWRREKLDLTAFVNRSPVQVVFRNTNNFGNNIYLDNVNLSSKTLPALLKSQGYLIYPSPFNTQFTIQHYLSPTDLRSYTVYNSVGQLMTTKSFTAGGAASFMTVDASAFANGVYTVVLRYTNKTISQKLVKAK